jgi:hypothetical protein
MPQGARREAVGRSLRELKRGDVPLEEAKKVASEARDFAMGKKAPKEVSGDVIDAPKPSTPSEIIETHATMFTKLPQGKDTKGLTTEGATRLNLTQRDGKSILGMTSKAFTKQVSNIDSAEFIDVGKKLYKEAIDHQKTLGQESVDIVAKLHDRIIRNTLSEEDMPKALKAMKELATDGKLTPRTRKILSEGLKTELNVMRGNK